MHEKLAKDSEFIKFVEKTGLKVVDHEIQLSYENFGYQEVLQESLPKGIEIPGGFEQVGDIAHMNLSAEQMPFKKIIGQVMLEKN